MTFSLKQLSLKKIQTFLWNYKYILLVFIILFISYRSMNLYIQENMESETESKSNRSQSNRSRPNKPQLNRNQNQSNKFQSNKSSPTRPPTIHIPKINFPHPNPNVNMPLFKNNS